MIIRNEQIDAFLPQTNAEICDFIITHLQEESPELIDRIPPDGLREMVNNGVGRARSHRINLLANLTAFVSLMFEIAPNFDEQEQLKQVLEDKDRPGDKNFDWLFEPELDAAWESAAESYESKKWAEAWFPELRDQ